MGAILQYINKCNEGNCHCFGTQKRMIDDVPGDVAPGESSEADTVPLDTKGLFAEDDVRCLEKISVLK